MKTSLQETNPCDQLLHLTHLLPFHSCRQDWPPRPWFLNRQQNLLQAGIFSDLPSKTSAVRIVNLHLESLCILQERQNCFIKEGRVREALSMVKALSREP